MPGTAKSQSAEKTTVLLIEDEEMLSAMYEVKFAKEGFRFLKAGDGQAGLDMAIKEQPDIILLDIIMPKLDGFAVLKELRQGKGTREVPIILLTNLGQEEDIAKGQQLGATGYLVKANNTPAQVVQKVRDTLGLKAA